MITILNFLKNKFGVSKPVALPYPQSWKQYIEAFPTERAFYHCWYVVFDVYPDECVVHVNPEGGLIVDIPSTGRIIHHPGFDETTETPYLLDREVQFWETDSSNWGFDVYGDRYWKINKVNGFPRPWIEVRAYETIRNFILTKPNNKYTKEWRNI